jgi:hypothetical protein
MRISSLLPILAVLAFSACTKKNLDTSVLSPDDKIQVHFSLSEQGEPRYDIYKKGKTIIKTSKLGFQTTTFDYTKGFTVEDAVSRDFSEVWEPVWGQQQEVKNEYRELTVKLKNSEGELLNIIFRAFNDGVGFRYEFPLEEETGNEELIILDEMTEFRQTADHTTWWTPGCWDNDEYPYTESEISKIDATYFLKEYPYSNVTSIPEIQGVNTPVTMKTKSGHYISIHEAALVNFPGMSLSVDINDFTFRSNLAEKQLKKGVKAEVQLPFKTPWRTIQITENAGDLTLSHLIYNLNEPNALENTDWIKPMKYMGIWWEMHVGKSDWAKAGGKHGATTENAKHYIDFCAENGIKGLLIEGWNTGWEDWTGDDREGIFDFKTPYSDFDLKGVVEYAREKGVEIIGHHETAAAVETYEKHMDTAYDLYEKLGIKSVKTGYVGKIPNYRHYEQEMVNHYNKTMMETAKHNIMLDIHEPIKQTGLSRTYPNLMGGEGMRGQEFNAWSDGNKPSHNVILPFTRMLAGPMDFTPGIFDLKLEKHKNSVTKVVGFDTREGGEALVVSRVYSTLAHQLGLYVVFYSPIQMVADLPENYDGNTAFQFIKDVAVDWEWSKIIDAEIASHIVTVRKEKGAGRWFIGGITGEKSREAALSFDFLPKNKTFKAILYRDGAGTEMMENPTAYEIEEFEVKSDSKRTVLMKPAGGFAISIIE